jgi:hypothetical protein
MLNARQALGNCDVLFITLDTLRYDVATRALELGQTPNLAQVLPGGRWELRHSPATFTYAAHHAFFAGFLPTPARPGRHPRLFAAQFQGSETTGEHTCVFDAPDIVRGFAQHGYHTICIGGVGFFNKRTPLGQVLPGLFAESHWDESLGVTDPDSTAHQVRLAVSRLSQFPADARIFLFLNVSALHQPNRMYLPGAHEDSADTQQAALRYVDSCLPELFGAVRPRAPTLCNITSDHGTAYGEDGFTGHRLAHAVVWNVPYAEFQLPPDAELNG